MQNLVQTKCPALLLACHVCALTLLVACKERSYSSPPGYDMEKGQKMELGKVLNEISGITWYAENNALLAISDSKEKVIEINLDRRKLKDFTDKVVGPQQDIEDVVKTDSALFLLASRGVIYKVSLHQKDTSGVSAFTFPSKDKNEFETLYYDPSANSLVMLCKECGGDKGKGIRSAYRFDLATERFDPEAFYTISTDDVKKVAGDEQAKFDPSAAAINPIDHRLYILSSAGNLLAIADTHGKIGEVFELDPRNFPQAEGIAFAPNGDMYISNEGKFGNATLQIFPYQPEKEQKKGKKK
jgi:uncharacterized protein YjiK